MSTSDPSRVVYRIDPGETTSSSELNLETFASREETIILPSRPADRRSNSWTCLYLVTPPLPTQVQAVQFDITSHDQGWCSDRRNGLWSWFEVSILRPAVDDAHNPSFDQVYRGFGVKSCPEDFTTVLQEQGLLFRNVSRRPNDDQEPNPRQISQHLLHNSISRSWETHTVTWSLENLNEIAQGLLGLVQRGDRLAIWGRAQFPGWMNFIKEVRIKVQTSERSQPSSDGLMSQAGRSIGQDISTPTDRIDRMERITTGSPLRVMNGSPSQQITPTLRHPHLSTSTVYMSLDRISRDAILPLIERHISRDPSEVIRQLMERRPQDRIAIVNGVSKFFQGLKSYRSYEMTGQIEDLENALQNMRQGADMIPISRGDSSPLAILSPMVGLVIFLHCKKTNQMDGLHEAIQRMQNIDIIEPGDEPEIGPSLSLHMSTMAFQLMFEQSRDLNHLHESIRRAQKGVDALSPQSPLFLIGSSLLGCLLVLRFEETNEVEDLDKTISLLESAKDHTLPQYRNQLPLLMTVLGGALYHRFKRTGSAADLDQGIHYTQKAVEDPGSCQDLALHLQNLGELLECRFDRDNRLDDIYEAIRRTKQASDIVIARGAADSTLLNNLSTKFIALHKRTRNVEDLKEGIQYAKLALDHIYQRHDILPAQLNADVAKIQHNLSHMNILLYWDNNRSEALFAAVQHAKDAIDITAESDPALVIYVKNLGDLLRLRWRMTGRVEDLLEAVRRDHQVINLAEKDDPQLALYLKTLGSTYSLFDRPNFRALAIGSFYRSWKYEFGPPIVRLQSARKAVQLLKQQSRWIEALDIAKQTVNLIPDINSRSLSRDDQRSVSRNFSGLAEDICSLMLQLDENPYDVLHWSELCRGVIMGQLMEDRSEISILAQSYPEEATEYDRLRNEVNTTTPDLEGDDFRLMRTQKLLETVTKLEECISSIRALPGFERFLLGPSLSELKHHAAEGPIIIVNVTELRSDAIIIQESGVDSIELPQLSRKKTTEWIEQSLTTYNDPIERGKKNKRYLEFLKWLWTSCVELVLDKIFDPTEHADQGELPRVWWIGVGIATHLPFHAAGDHSARSTNNTISRAISSYTPTIKALIYSRERGTTITRLDEKKPKAMVVTMPHTPGKVDLPGVEREQAAIEEHSGSTFITSTLNEPSSKVVLENVKECDVLHFAGHGISDYHDPFNSSLLLTKHDGADAIVDRLTVRDIFDLHLKQAKLAYLSACSTAEVQEERLLDEVIHLASGFQVAGFNHVIASMWQTDDDACEGMASDFYSQLKKGGQQALDNRAVVAAAHHATLAVRSRWPRQPLMWAPYVHIGV